MSIIPPESGIPTQPEENISGEKKPSAIKETIKTVNQRFSGIRHRLRARLGRLQETHIVEPEIEEFTALERQQDVLERAISQQVDSEQTKITEDISLDSHEGVESLRIVDELIGSDSKFQDWIPRIHRRFEKEDMWHMEVIKAPNEEMMGFVLLSDSTQKLAGWSDKFQQKDWISEPIDLEHSTQFAYFYMKESQRGKGLGEKALHALFDKLKTQGKNTLFGFSRYTEPISLYERTGATILNKNDTDSKGTYYYWKL